MTCKRAQQILIGQAEEGKRDQLAEAQLHAQTCEACAQMVAFDFDLRSSLQMEATPRPEALARIRKAMSGSSPVETWNKKRRIRIMKIASLAAAAATTIVLFAAALLPNKAQASEAKKKFEEVGVAVAAKFAKPKQAGHDTVLEATSRKEWFYVNGELAQIIPDGHSGPEPGEGSNQDPVILPDKNPKFVIRIPVSLSMNPRVYRSIEFGPNKDTLVLTKSYSRFILSVDHKSDLPKEIISLRLRGGKWVKTADAHLDLTKGS